MDGDGVDEAVFRGEGDALETKLILGGYDVLAVSGTLVATDVGAMLDPSWSGFALRAIELDGDGYADFATHAGDETESIVQAGLSSGDLGTLSAMLPIAELHGAEPGDEFGAEVSTAATSTGDAATRLAVSTHTSDFTYGAGEVYLYDGRVVAAGGAFEISDALFVIAGVTGLAPAGNLDGDGTTDLVAGIGLIYIFTDLW